MGNEIVLKKKAYALAPYWNRQRKADLRMSTYIGKYRYPNYVGKDFLTLNMSTLQDSLGNSRSVVYPPVVDGSSYLESKKKENQQHSLFLQGKAPTYYPFRRSLMHLTYSLPERQAGSDAQCFA